MMRRLRHASRKPDSAAPGRLLKALLFSTAVHAVVIGAWGWLSDPSAQGNWSLIQARLVPASPVLQVAPAAKPAAVRSLSLPVTPLLPAESGLPDAPPPAGVPALSADTPAAAAPLPENAPAPAEIAVPDLVHYPVKDLDLFPQLLAPLAPAYPQTAREAGVGGVVTLLVLVDEAGRVTDVSIMDAVPQGVFEESARQAFTRASFSPAQKAGRAVRSRILVSVDFDPGKID